jgi:hypothetical protein
METITNAERCRLRYLRWKTDGLCTRCGTSERLDGYEYCNNCKIKNKLRMDKLKDETFVAYGGYVCACCGETNKVFLTIDHINNDGYKSRKEGKRTRDLRLLLKKQGYPPGFRVLCFNCNSGRHINGGTCPHQTKDFLPFTFIA